jgi:hypothetical protein
MMIQSVYTSYPLLAKNSENVEKGLIINWDADLVVVFKMFSGFNQNSGTFSQGNRLESEKIIRKSKSE